MKNYKFLPNDIFFVKRIKIFLSDRRKKSNVNFFISFGSMFQDFFNKKVNILCRILFNVY